MKVDEKMENLYIDESGSMTCHYCDENPFFIIAIIRAINNDRLKRMYKRFVSSKIDRLRELDWYKIIHMWQKDKKKGKTSDIMFITTKKQELEVSFLWKQL